MAVASFCQPTPSLSQEPVALGVDADPAGNKPTSLGTIERCISVSTGDTFNIDLFVANVADLLSWEAYVFYDPSVLKLGDREVKLFLAATTGSNVFDASDAPPGLGGRYRVAAADVADPPAVHTGSGVLARLTFHAISSGVSLIGLPRLDLSGDGKPDIGPILTAVSGERIGDGDSDAYFDGPVADAWIAVDTVCPQQPPPLPTVAPFAVATSTPPPRATQTATPSATPRPTPPPTTDSRPEDEDGLPWALIGVLSAGVVVLVAGGLFLWRIRVRRRA